MHEGTLHISTLSLTATEAVTHGDLAGFYVRKISMAVVGVPCMTGKDKVSLLYKIQTLSAFHYIVYY